MPDQLVHHREAFAAVRAAMPGSVYISHEDGPNPDWEQCEISMPTSGRQWHCSTCGDHLTVAGLTVKCRDWHEICRDCGARYDQPKNPGCRRRKHPKPPEETKK